MVKDTPLPAGLPKAELLQPPEGLKPMKASRVKGLTVVNTIMAHEQPVSGIALHPDGEAFVSVGDDGFMKLWSLPRCVIEAVRKKRKGKGGTKEKVGKKNITGVEQHFSRLNAAQFLSALIPFFKLA